MSKKNDSKKPLKLYNDEQFKLIEEHIEKNFGEINNYFQERNPENIHVKIYTVPPTKEKPYYTLITVGMGAYFMNVPECLDEEKLKRAELVICLPPNWKINNNEPEYRWPLQLLSMLSRLPIEENTWLGCGHTVDYGEGFAEESGFNGIILTHSMAGKDSCICKFSDDDEVNFYQVILLHQSELDFKNKNGSNALMSLFKKDLSPVYNPDRKSVVPENFREILDTVEEHSCKVEEKELDTLDINGANHIAAFLRWSIEHNLINDEILEYFAEDIEQIQSGEYDIRKFLINSLGGELTTDLFNDKGKAFCKYYYDRYHGKDEPCYPADVDRMALDYFGEEKYNCEEFDDEAYLFVPFDEDYYTAISRYIDKNYEDFKNTLINNTIDSFDDHVWKIKEKCLDIPEENAGNHISAFLKWCIEHNLMSENFMEFYSQYKKKIESGKSDIRYFFINNIEGKLTMDMFNEEGQAFCKYYYDFCNESDEPCYPEDVDRMALDYFGEEKYNSEEFQDEAYLFVPFDEDYYNAISRYIDANYEDFKNALINNTIDSFDDHVWKIRDKELDIPEINAVSHITAFLRWSIEHKLVSDTFLNVFCDFQEDFESGTLDLRRFMLDYYNGELSTDMFNCEGHAFCRYYYDFCNESDEPCYPEDVDRMALDYFGEEKYNCEEFQDEAYLFVPFDEDYYTAISRYIYKNYLYFKNDEAMDNPDVVDSIYNDLWRAKDKNLDVPEINFANSISAFLRWSIEHNLMCEEFMEFFSYHQKKVESGEFDIRDFVINNLEGEITMNMFNDEGQAFCKYYYNSADDDNEYFSLESDNHCYLEDIDKMALEYFGGEKFKSEKFADMAFLFVPFNKTYYRNISKYINRNYRKFKKIYKK